MGKWTVVKETTDRLDWVWVHILNQLVVCLDTHTPVVFSLFGGEELGVSNTFVLKGNPSGKAEKGT